MTNPIKKYKNMSKPMKASLWFLIAGLMQRGISVITTPIFTRLLTTDEYGIYSVFNSWLEVFTVIITLKLAAGVYMQKMVKLDSEKERNIFTSSLLGLATTSCLAWFVIYMIFRKPINQLIGLSTILMIFMFVMMWSTVCFNFWSTRQRIEYEYRALVIITILVSVSKPALGIAGVLLLPKWRVEARIGAIALAELLIFGWMFFYLFKDGKIYFHKDNWKYALGFNLPLIPHYLSQSVLNSSDRIMIKAMDGETPAGIYGLAYNISTLMLIFNNAINNTLNPWIYQSIKEKNVKRIGKVSYSLLIIIAIMNLALILLAPEVITIFAPTSYHEAIWVIPPVAMAIYFRFMYCLFADFEFYFEKTKFVMIASMTGAILNLILNYVFIKQYGYIAAAYTTLICYMVYSFMHFIFMRIVLKKNEVESPYNVKILALISVIFMGIGFALMFLYDYAIVRYTIVLVGVIVAIIFRKKIMELFRVLKKRR